MSNSRRSFICGAVSAAALGVSLFCPTKALANSGFEYDALGRLTKATLADGTTVYYRYDAAGNRTEVDSSGGPPPPPPPFNATINVTGTAPVNLRSLADAAGYTGAQPATITFNVASGVTLMGVAGAPNGGVAIDTGQWPTGTYPLSLTLAVSGKVYGGGGSGGDGTTLIYDPYPDTSLVNALPGGSGGDAVYCRIPITIIVNAGGEVKGGAGGGGGGGAAVRYRTGKLAPVHGSGGGGGFPNGPPGTGYGNSPSGQPGTPQGGGAGGPGRAVGAGIGTPAATGGAGGNGGAAGSQGSSGGTASSGSSTPGAAGAAGYAIRKNGNNVPVTNNGTIAGSQG